MFSRLSTSLLLEACETLVYSDPPIYASTQISQHEIVFNLDLFFSPYSSTHQTYTLTVYIFSIIQNDDMVRYCFKIWVSFMTHRFCKVMS